VRVDEQLAHLKVLAKEDISIMCFINCAQRLSSILQSPTSCQ